MLFCYFLSIKCSWWANTLIEFLIHLPDQGIGVDGFTIQQQSQWHPSRWDGLGQNYPDNCLNYIPYGEEKSQWPVSYHCPTVVSVSN